VRAARIILAAGGIENPRILLASRSVEENGIGNRHDQVGRYFMEHPHGRIGRIVGDHGFALWNGFRMRFPAGHIPVAPVLRASRKVQMQRGLLNSALTFKLQRDPRSGVPKPKALYQSLKHELNPTNTNRGLWHWYRETRLAYRRWLRPKVERLKANSADRVLSVMIRGEQSPNPASRVGLSTRKDRHGVPLSSLDWHMSAIDKTTVRGLGEVLDAELQRLSLGRLQMEEWVLDGGTDWPVDPTVGNHPHGGYHHMGTTRMSSAPTTGVVDPHCRVHGYRNLYVAGSSVFSTGGWANPTLTIMALAFRLADHLKAQPPG
jgi:choline dehydrogenase-like flavoprotein